MNFSVLASVYNKEIPENLILALDSVFFQTLLPNEVVLVKDGHLTENLDKIIENYQLKFPNIFKVIPLEKNVGLGNALNIGLTHCKNNIIARMDTDDICYRDRFEKQIDFLCKNPDISVVGSVVQEFNYNPGDLNQFRKLPESNKELLLFAKYRNPLNHPSVVFRKNDVIKVGSYQDMLSFEDYYLWIRMIHSGLKLHNFQNPLLHFRIGNDMIGRRQGIEYARKEIKFLKVIKRMGFISTTEFYKSIFMKLPLRLLPKKVLLFIYKKVLR